MKIYEIEFRHFRFIHVYFFIISLHYAANTSGYLTVPSTLLLAFCPFLLCYPRVCLFSFSNVYLFYCCFNRNEFLTRKCLLIWELCLGHQYDGFIVQNMLIIKPQNEYKEELISVISSSYSIVFNITI